MSKVARIISVIASIVAVASQIAFFVTGNPIFLVIAAAAAAIGAVAGAVAQLTQRPPDMKGTVNQVMIGKNLPIIYAMGLTYVGGMMVYDKSANGPDNYDRTQIMVGSAAGPIEGFQDFLGDYNSIGFVGGSWNVSRKATGFYGADGGYLWVNSRAGLRPETALTPYAGRDAFDAWGSDYKLSGYAAWSVTMEWDEDGVRYAGGIPQWGMVAKWVKIYDPRADDTYPGGSGDHRWDDEGTFEYGAAGVGTVAIGENPALHALTYARGRFIEKDAGGSPLATPVKICGIGLPKVAIKVSDFVELANLCDVNGWTVGGALYEGPGLSKWDNLKRILQCAAAEPVWSGGVLSLKWNAPKTPVFTIGRDQLADGEIELQAMKGWRDRINTIVPRVRLATHKYEYEQLEAVTSATYLTEDGEEKTKEVQFDLCQDVDQGAQLAAYQLVDSRELGPWRVPVKPEFMVFRPGEAGTLKLSEILDDPALDDQLVVITGRTIDPANGAVLLLVETETDTKHAFALGLTGTAPPTPVIVPPEDIDGAVSGTDRAPTLPATIDLVTWTDRMVMRTEAVQYATGYVWNFYDPGDLVTPIRTITTSVPQVEYTKAQAHADGVRRDYVVDVAAVNSFGTGDALASGTLTNAAPAAPTGVAFADGTTTSTVTGTPSASSDAVGHLVCWATGSSFDPMTDGASIYAGGFPAYTPQLAGGTYYGKAAGFDLWSSQPDLLNFCAEDGFTISTGVGSAPGGGGGGGFGGGGGGGGGGGNEY